MFRKKKPLGLAPDVLKYDRLQAAALLAGEYLVRYGAFLDASPWGILVTDTGFTIQFINATLERMSGWTRDEIIGQPIEVLIPESIRPVHEKHQVDFKQRPRTRHGDYPFYPQLLCKDGSLLAVEISLGHSRIEGQQYFFASIRPRESLDNILGTVI